MKPNHPMNHHFKNYYKKTTMSYKRLMLKYPKNLYILNGNMEFL